MCVLESMFVCVCVCMCGGKGGGGIGRVRNEIGEGGDVKGGGRCRGRWGVHKGGGV